MQWKLFVLLGLVAMATARPDSILDLVFDTFSHGQDFDDQKVFGSYSWRSPDGTEYFVKYVADDDGYRVLESNAVPVSVGGVFANGQQGAFLSSEEFDFDDRK
ncbi:uncharacterized protein LOC134766688 [Penaeus indicus]|uniref:uncharacterized protein LOC134766688 n=1 Tax=Penaeus indicus TaxID=29960 RepID=UPI00300C6F12